MTSVTPEARPPEPATGPAPTWQVTVDGTHRFTCGADEAVLAAMTRSGLGAIASGCHGGGCGVCRIRVVEGAYRTRRMSRAHVSEDDEAAGIVLACRTYPEADLTVRAMPRRTTRA